MMGVITYSYAGIVSKGAPGWLRFNTQYEIKSKNVFQFVLNNSMIPRKIK